MSMSEPTIPKPAPCPVQPENIPDEMKGRPQWVCWRWEWKPPTGKASGKWDKPPYDPKTGHHARSNDSKTWATFDVALAAYRDQANGYSGIGYMFSGQPDDFTGIDLDDCRDPQTGEIRAWTPEQRACEHWTSVPPDPQQIIEVTATYAEVSPSGTGVKLIVRGTIPGGIKHGDIEMYRSGRYFTVTGHRLSDCPSTINEYSALAYLHGLFSAKAMSSTNGRQRKVPQKKQTHAANSGNGKMPTLEQMLAACDSAANGDKFRRLFGGDVTGYTGHSEADAALCAIIAFWSAGNAGLIDQVFRQSKLMRDKWDEARGERTYGERTIDFALEGIDEFYDWAKTAGKLAIASQTVGNITLVPMSVRRTATKITVQLEIQQDGKPLDLKKLTDSESNRKSVLKAIVARVGEDSATAQELDAALGLILVEAAQQKERDGDEKSIYEILAEYVPGELDLQYATEGGRAFSGKLSKVISRQMFVERFTSNMVLQLASTGADAPISDEGEVLRGQLIGIVERELKVLWGELFFKLGTVEEVDLTDNSPTAVAYRQAIISLWTRPASMSIHKTPIADGQSVQLATRNSLALRVRKLEEAAVASGKWHHVQDGFDAYMRIEDGPTAGEHTVVLAMRYELAQQIGVTIPDTTNQTALTRLGIKFGAVTQSPKVYGRPIPSRMSGGGYMSVLSTSITGAILARPSEELDKDECDPSDEQKTASEASEAGPTSPSEAVRNELVSLEKICEEMAGDA
jgi:putative DNA primase/helicase